MRIEGVPDPARSSIQWSHMPDYSYVGLLHKVGVVDFSPSPDILIFPIFILRVAQYCSKNRRTLLGTV